MIIRLITLLSKPQPNLNTTVGFDKEMTLQRQDKGKVKARLRQGQGKVMAMSKPVQDKVRASSWQGQGEDKAR